MTVWSFVGGTLVEVVSFLTVNVDPELEAFVVTSAMVVGGTFVTGFVGFVGVGFGLVTPTVAATVDDNDGLVLSVVVAVLGYSLGLVVLVVVLVTLVGFNFVVLDNNGLDVVALLSDVVVFTVVVVGLTVVVLLVDVFRVVLEVVLEVVLGVVVLVIDGFWSGLLVVTLAVETVTF